MRNSYPAAQPRISAGAFKVITLLVALIPAFILLPHILRDWVDFPYWDDWATPGKQIYDYSIHNLTFKEMFSQHNESRPFFPRLVFIALGVFGEWDVRRVMAAFFLMICMEAWLLCRLVRSQPGIKPLEKLMLVLLMGFVLFWPSETWTFANTFMLAWPPAMLLCSLNVNLGGATFRNKILLNTVLATIATWSWSNGLLLWALALPLPAGIFAMRWTEMVRKEARWWGAYAFVAVVNVVFYFQGFHSEPLSLHLPRLLEYFFTWLGGFCGEFECAGIVGRCAFFSFLALVFIYTGFAFKKRDFSSGYPWLVLGLYAVLSGVLASMGRAKAGSGQAMSTRYTMVAGYLYIAIFGLGYVVWREACLQWPARRVNVFRFAAGFAMGALMTVAIPACLRGMAMMDLSGLFRRDALAAWQWSKVIPHNPGIKTIYPQPEIVELAGTYFEQKGILKAKRWEPEVASHWNYEASTSDTLGALELSHLNPDGSLDVAGWAWLQEQGRPADYVLITACGPDGATRPYVVLASDFKRPDIAAAHRNSKMLHTGFNQTIPPGDLPKGHVTITAWAMDMQHASITRTRSSGAIENN